LSVYNEEIECTISTTLIELNYFKNCQRWRWITYI